MPACGKECVPVLTLLLQTTLRARLCMYVAHNELDSADAVTAETDKLAGMELLGVTRTSAFGRCF